MLIYVLIIISFLAVYALYLYLIEQIFDSQVYLLKHRIRFFALGALLPICSLIVINAFLAEIAITADRIAFDTFSDQVPTLIALELVKGYLDGVEVGYPILREMEGFSITCAPQVHLVASVFFYQV